MEIDGMEEETPHVLLVEDDEGLADLYTIWLEEFCSVTAVNDCETAYEKFGESFDVVLLDRHLPDGTGDELLQEIRTLSMNWPVAMVTGEEPKLSDLHMDFDEYINKPASKEEIQNIVSRLVAQSGFEKKLTKYNRLMVKKKLIEENYPLEKLSNNNDYLNLLRKLKKRRCDLITKSESFTGANIMLEENTSHVNSD